MGGIFIRALIKCNAQITYIIIFPTTAVDYKRGITFIQVINKNTEYIER